MKKVVILNFSGKEHGNCSSIADYISKIYCRTNVLSFRVADYFSPCGRCEYECLKPGFFCPRMGSDEAKIMEAICESKLTYYLIPNYCGSPCANYYAFNERTVGWFNGEKSKMQQYMDAEKRFIFISNTEAESFYQIPQQHCSVTPKMMFLASRKYNKMSISGDLLESDDAKADLEHFLD